MSKVSKILFAQSMKISNKIKVITLLLGLFSIFILSSYHYPDKVKPAISKVVIDAGHGGKDPGCKGQKAKEKDVALSIALALGHYIEQNFPDVIVIYTRRDDHFVELFQRAEIANKNKADLFISIHCNASPSNNPYGLETYVMGLHKSEANLNIAKKENSSILYEDDYKKRYDGFNPNSPEAYIIFSLYQNAYLDQSLNLASKIQKQFEDIGRFNRGVKQAGFLVLYKTTMPGMLVETGFLSNPKEEEFMTSDAGQDKIALSIFRAFKAYKNEREGALSQSSKVKSQKKDSSIKYQDTRQKEKQNLKEIAEKPKTDSQNLYQKKTRLTEDTSKKTLNESQKSKSIVQSDGAVVFKVQFMTSAAKKSLSSLEFKGLDNIESYFENGLNKYTIGNENKLDEAKKILFRLKQKGFKDAFIIAFIDGKRLKNISEALSKSNDKGTNHK